MTSVSPHDLIKIHHLCDGRTGPNGRGGTAMNRLPKDESDVGHDLSSVVGPAIGPTLALL